MISTQDKTADDPFYPHVISGDLSGYMMFGTYSRPAEEGRWYTTQRLTVWAWQVKCMGSACCTLEMLRNLDQISWFGHQKEKKIRSFGSEQDELLHKISHVYGEQNVVADSCCCYCYCLWVSATSYCYAPWIIKYHEAGMHICEIGYDKTINSNCNLCRWWTRSMTKDQSWEAEENNSIGSD